MNRLLVLAFVLALFAFIHPAFAQEGPAGAGRTEITFIPVGALMFTENTDASAPSFGNYQLGCRRHLQHQPLSWCRRRGERSIGISQSLDFGYSSSVSTRPVFSHRVYGAVMLNVGR